MALKQDIALLRTLPLFAALGPEPLRLVAFSAERRTLRAGDVLFTRGEPSDAGFVVVEGTLALDRGDAAAQPALAGPGTLVGEMALIADTERPATASAREGAVVLRIPRGVFRRMLEEFPEAAEALRALLARRAQATSERLAGVRQELLAIDRAAAARRRG